MMFNKQQLAYLPIVFLLLTTCQNNETPPDLLSDIVCFPAPAVIPGESGAPEWWGVVTGRKDDPRWQGALSISHTDNHGRFRALQANDGGIDYLYLNWEIFADGGGGSEDYIYFGFVNPLLSTGHNFRITVPTDTGVGAVNMKPIQPSQVQIRSKLATGVAWSAFTISDADTAPWIQETGRYWIECPNVCSSYNVQLRVPISTIATLTDISTGLNLPDDILFWYDMQIINPVFPPTTEHHSYPDDEPYSVANFLNFDYPTANDWGEVKIKSNTGCEGANISY